MADSVVSSVIARVGVLITQEMQYLLGVEDQVDRLQRELRRMKAFLKEADSRKAEDERVRQWIAEIKDIAYDAEDVIETFALKTASKGDGSISNAIKRSACILKEACILHKVRSDIVKVISKISDLTQSLQTYGLKDISYEEGSSSSSRVQEIRRSFPHTVETNVVGLDNNINELVSFLADEGINFRVACVCGMGGLGKTTLAKKVYHHSRVRSHFKYFVWVYISQQCQRKTVWKGILSSLGLIEERERGGLGLFNLEDDDYQQKLAERLYNFLKENKCLVVLDDIWHTQDWDAIKPAFPMEETTGSKILLTTRNRDVALHIGSRGWLHELPFLTDEDGLKLFLSIAFPIIDSKDYEKKMEVGKDMLKQCAGLPLAIVMLGGILATKHSLNDWQTVHENVKSFLRRGRGGGIHEVLALSYDDLPAYLKPCFLYLSIFPEDYEISASKLIQLWVAENLVLSSASELGGGEEMVEDVAEGYLDELVERFMVQVGKRDACLKIKTCRMHDFVRDLCLLKSEQENFVNIVDPLRMVQTGVSIFSSTEFGKVRRHAIHKSVWVTCIKNPYMRSLFLFDRIVSKELISERYPHYESWVMTIDSKIEVERNRRTEIKTCWPLFQSLFQMIWAFLPLLWIGCQLLRISQGSLKYILNNFKLLRVLDFEKAHVQMGCKLLTNIGCLTHLRYLKLGANSCVSRLPPSLGKLRFLISLDLRVNVDVELKPKVHVPNVIWRMQRLRHLYLPNRCDRKTKLKLGNLWNLQTLVNFNTKNCYLGDLSNMKNLKELAINTPFNVEHFGEDLDLNPQIIITSKHVRSLSVMSDERTNPRHLTFLLSGCVDNIYELDLIVEIAKLPELHPTSSNIVELRLIGTALDEDPMPILEKLPNLRSLEFEKQAFVGLLMICSANGFSQLETLAISSHTNLEELRLNKGAMSNLRRLMIKNCKKLKMLPDELSCIKTLEELKIEKMPKAFKDRLVRGAEDNYKVQHVPSIIFRDCDDLQS